MAIANYMFDIWYWLLYGVISLFLLQDFIISTVLFVIFLAARRTVKKLTETYLK